MSQFKILLYKKYIFPLTIIKKIPPTETEKDSVLMQLKILMLSPNHEGRGRYTPQTG